MPFVPLLPAVGIQFNFILAAGLDGVTWAYFLGFVAIGLIIYFSYSIRHSHLEASYVMRGKIETSIVEGEASPLTQEWSKEEPIRKSKTEPEDYMLVDTNGEKKQSPEIQRLI